MKRGVALLLVLALVLAGVGVAGLAIARLAADDYDAVAMTAPSGTPAADTPPDPSLARYYGQRLDWERCGATECTTLDVPLDYAQPSGETIGIHVVRRLADDEDDRVGTLLVNPGGPGAAGSTIATNAASYLGEPLLRHLDVVGFDPRGTGESDPVDCLDDADLDAYLAADPEPETPTEVPASTSAGSVPWAVAAPSSAAPSPPTSPPRRAPATWTCCARPWGTG